MNYSSRQEMRPTIDHTLRAIDQKFPDGIRGNYKTVKFMKKKAIERAKHPFVRQLVIQILNHNGTESHNHLDEARAIGEWVKANVRYMKDPAGIELLQDPVMLIEQAVKGEARGDCDDMVLLAMTLLICAGIKPWIKVVRYHNDFGPYNHIYLAVNENNYRGNKEWLIIDPIVKDEPIGYEVPHASSEVIDGMGGLGKFMGEVYSEQVKDDNGSIIFSLGLGVVILYALYLSFKDSNK